MKGLKKKVLSLVMVLAMVVSILPGMSVVANAADTTYTLKLGSNVTITYTSPNGEGTYTKVKGYCGIATLPYGSQIVNVEGVVTDEMRESDEKVVYCGKNASLDFSEVQYLEDTDFTIAPEFLRDEGAAATHSFKHYALSILNYWSVPKERLAMIPNESVKGFAISGFEIGADGEIGTYCGDSYSFIVQISTYKQKTAEDIEASINALGDMNRDKISLVEEIRKDYEKLSDEEKNKVSEDVLNVLIAAENMIPVYAVEDKITDIGVVTLESASAIESARTSFNELTDEQKAKVANENDLLAAEKELAYLEKNNDKAQAAKVQALIDDIATVSDWEAKEQKINDARKAYDALSAVQKAKIERLVVLVTAESELKAIKNAKKVQDIISALPEVNDLKLTDNTSVTNAKNNYDALTNYEKDKIPSADKTKLENAVTKMQQLLKAADEAAPSHTVEVEGAFALEYDGVSGSTVKEIGTTTNGKVYLVTLPAGAKATGLYNGTSGKGLTYFYYPELPDNVGTGGLDAYSWQRTQSAMVFNVSNTFYNDQFAFLQTYLNKKDTIKQNLSETLPTQDVKGFAFGSSYAIVYVQIKLTDVESVTKKIEALGDASEENLDTIEAVKAAYDNLSEEEKAQITNVDKLNTAVEAMEAMKAEAAADKAAADAVIEQIKAVETVTADNVADVAAAREAYDALTDAQKALVDEKTVGILEKAEATAKYEAAKKEYESLKESNNASNAELEAAKKELEAAKNENESLKESNNASNAELEAAKKELEAAKTELAKEKAKNQTVTGLKVTSKSKKLTVTWKKNSAVKGYQVSYKLKSAKKYVTMKKTTGTKVRSKALKKGKVYQVKVRPYSVIGGKTIYGRWTSVKTIKCK